MWMSSKYAVPAPAYKPIRDSEASAASSTPEISAVPGDWPFTQVESSTLFPERT